MKKVLAASLYVCFISAIASADTFGTGANQFTIDFVNISGATNPVYGYGIVNNDYRMGKFEITNDQWNKFKSSLGVSVTGNPSNAYDENPRWTGANVPTNGVSWYEAAQFVNYLNTSKGYQAAYKFTGTQGTSDYTLGVWSALDAGYNASNRYRNSNAFYFLPTEDEWIKAAYWNGATLQTYATKAGQTLYQGNGSNGGWNYDYSTMQQPWIVGSGSQELNGTYDMMGNVWEWMESPYHIGDYFSDSYRCIRGDSYNYADGNATFLRSYNRTGSYPNSEGISRGFRIASIPEPASALLMLLGTAWMGIKRKRKVDLR